ncbi:Bacteriophage tail assembly protein [Serratia liquefaciens]|nr:Bacteriophage tail assembly protein [Serratia liquefaciens]
MAGQAIKLFEFQKEPLNAILNRGVKKVVLMSSAQLLKTTILNNAAFYLMANDSSNMGFANSTGRELDQWKKGKIDPVVEKCPALKELMTDKNDKRYANNNSQIQMKDGSFLYFMSLNAAAHLRGKSLRYVFMDEVSNVDAEGEEGNPLRLAEQRTAMFQDNGLIMIASTPKFSNDTISTEYALSDQRKYFIECPHCQHEHTLEFENIEFGHKQVNDGKRAIADGNTARLICPACRQEITESQRIRAVKKGRWIATNPIVTDVVGFHINRLYSPITTIKKIVDDYGIAMYEYSLQSYYNNTLGLPWDDDFNKELDDVLLENLRDDSFDLKKIPDTCLGLVMGIDQQLDRLECTVMGISERELWVLGHRIFYSPDCTKIEAKAWTELENFITARFKTVTGRDCKVLSAFIDSSNGNATNTVYRFCTRNKLFHPIKGSSSLTSEMFKRSTAGGHQLYMLNVNDGKNEIRKLLNTAVSDDADDTPVRMRFTHDLPQDYFPQLTSEQLKRKGDGLRWVLKKGEKRNESLDCCVYAYICGKYVLSKLGNQPFAELRKYVAKQRKQMAINKMVEPKNENEPDNEFKIQQKSNTPRRNRRPKGNGWFGQQG